MSTVKLLKRAAVLLTVMAIAAQPLSVYAKTNDVNPVKAEKSTTNSNVHKEIKGVWFSFVDHQNYLKGKNRAEYDQTFESICKKAKDEGLNSIFVHVRSHNDAIYPSKIYPWSVTMLNGDPGFDPLADMVEIAHKEGLEIHAWLNPYGYRPQTGISGNPALSTNDNVIAGVSEILDKYKVDGIHFDDYFPPIGGENIDQMVKSVHDLCKKQGVMFGIAPQGNIQNCISAGADVRKWLSTNEYVDYIAPQIYWTDRYGPDGSTPMSSTRLTEWMNINSGNIPMYVGMALYRAGNIISTDPGWLSKNDNLAYQNMLARAIGYDGYILYSATALMAPNDIQSNELKNLKMSESRLTYGDR